MTTNKKELFTTLAKILDRYDLSETRLPSDLFIWQQFIKRINNYFIEIERGHYLLERSVEISSREFRELNENLTKTQSFMVALSRQAGMSEIATSILHNIGNILNSVNISINILEENINMLKVEDFLKVTSMIKENLYDSTFLTSHPKGKLIPNYFEIFSESLIEDIKIRKEEVSNLKKNVTHINDIVMMQKDLSGISGVEEKIFLPELVDLAIKMSGDLKKYGIMLIKKYEYTNFIVLDKSKVLQILINLIKNAKESLELNQKNALKNLTISIKESRNISFIEIIVQDNGVGIIHNDLNKIFTFGYTTKTNGHGFGLHSSAIAAKELGGYLNAESPGEGKGAIFKLTIPNNL